MLLRAKARTIALQLLKEAVTQRGAQFSTSRDTPIQAGNTSSIVIYTDDVKEGNGSAPPAFRTTVLTTIEIVAEGKTKDDAEALCDTLCEITENALLNGASPFQRLFEQIDSVQTQPDYRGLDSKMHTFIAVIEIKAHTTEQFEPTFETMLTGANIYVDSVNVADLNGTYAPPFDYPVSAAPRDDGPDGRIEIAASIDIPQE